MKKSLCLLIVIIMTAPLFSLPSSYIDDDDPKGWGELRISFSYFPVTKDTMWSVGLLMFGEDLTWIDNDNLGFGCTLGWGGGNLLFSIDSSYYFDLPDMEVLTCPIVVRGGVEFPGDISFFASITGGLEWFAGGWTDIYEEDPDEQICINLGIYGGLYYYEQIIMPGIEAAVGCSTANAYSPSSGYYYY